MIKDLQNEKEALERKLTNILTTKQEAEELQGQIAQLSQGSTIGQIKARYEELTSRKRMISSILDIGILRERLSNLERIIEKNRIYLQKLANYENLTNAQYSNYVSFIELDYLY